MKATPPTAAQLEYLVAAVDAGSWSDAAEGIGVSPSAFTQAMAELEKRLGVVLFGKVGRRRVPTLDALIATEHARRILAELGSLDRWAAMTRDGELGTIRAGMIDTAAVHHFGDALVRFRTLHPELSVRLTVRPSTELFEELRRGDLDVVVAVAPESSEGVRIRPVVVEPLNIYAPPNVQPGDPNTWGPWVGFPQGSRTRSLIDQSLRRRGAQYEVVAESSQPSVLREMVRIGMGWTVLVPADAEREPHALRPALAQPLAKRTLVLGQPQDRPPSPALERFVAMLVSEATTDQDPR